MSLPAPPPRQRHDVPMLVLGAADDALFPPWMVRATAAMHGVKAEILPDIGHGMMLDAGWQRVAARIERWLREQVPRAPLPAMPLPQLRVGPVVGVEPVRGRLIGGDIKPVEGAGPGGVV